MTIISLVDDRSSGDNDIDFEWMRLVLLFFSFATLQKTDVNMCKKTKVEPSIRIEHDQRRCVIETETSDTTRNISIDLDNRLRNRPRTRSCCCSTYVPIDELAETGE
jgi:hypothetical protein